MSPRDDGSNGAYSGCRPGHQEQVESQTCHQEEAHKQEKGEEREKHGTFLSSWQWETGCPPLLRQALHPLVPQHTSDSSSIEAAACQELAQLCQKDDMT